MDEILKLTACHFSQESRISVCKRVLLAHGVGYNDD